MIRPEKKLILIGCSQIKNTIEYDQKRGGRVFPHELYSSPLYLKRQRYAQAQPHPYGILSAEYGLWWPDRGMKPYDTNLKDVTEADHSAWAIGVAKTVCSFLWEDWESGLADEPLAPAELTVELHAGRMYCDKLEHILLACGLRVERPTIGLGIGQQLRFYDNIDRASCSPSDRSFKAAGA